MRGRKNWGSLQFSSDHRQLFLVQIMNKTNKSTIRQQESLLERESGKKKEKQHSDTPESIAAAVTDTW